MHNKIHDSNFQFHLDIILRRQFLIPTLNFVTISYILLICYFHIYYRCCKMSTNELLILVSSPNKLDWKVLKIFSPSYFWLSLSLLFKVFQYIVVVIVWIEFASTSIVILVFFYRAQQISFFSLHSLHSPHYRPVRPRKHCSHLKKIYYQTVFKQNLGPFIFFLKNLKNWKFPLKVLKFS